MAKKPARRPRHDATTTKALILDAVEQLMLDEGYAAVSTRRVAAHAGLLPGLVQYHFPSSDEMLVAAYRRTTEINLDALRVAAGSADPLRSLWALQSDPTHTALAMEFMALANHRKAIKVEIASYSALSRRIKEEVFEKVVDPSVVDPAICPPSCATALMVSVGRTLITEEIVGISSGHAEVRTFVEWLIDKIKLRAPVTRDRKSNTSVRKRNPVRRRSTR